MAMQHRPWVGKEYGSGLAGNKIAIIGNSHWLNELDEDNSETTNFVVSEVCSGAFGNIAFFSQIRDYFGFQSHTEFWDRVLFFNYAPRSIGLGDQRYDHITSEMAEEAKLRFFDLVQTYRPDKIFVFSTKIRWALPPLKFSSIDASLKSAKRAVIREGDATSPSVYLLRHPQGASKQEMTETVSQIMEGG